MAERKSEAGDLKDLNIPAHLYLHLSDYIQELKLQHFQTPDYAVHLATDKLYTAIVPLFDKTLEVAQGIYGRISGLNVGVDILTMDKNTFHLYSIKMNKILTGLQEKITHSHLNNNIDSIKEEISTFIYLLSFQ